MRGTFSLRYPIRSNPTGTHRAAVGGGGSVLLVRGMDCLDGTPLLDLKLDRTLFEPIAPPQSGDFEIDPA